MNVPAFLQARSDGVYVSLKVQPRASKNEIGEVAGNELKVKVTAPPVDSAANEAVLRLLAEALDCPRNAVQLIRGASARHKQLRVVGMAVEEVARRLL
jgi:uncharacterized protein (TIGR00251 family)